MQKTRFLLPLASAFSALLIGGCMVGPDYDGVEPAPGTSMDWRGQTQEEYLSTEAVRPETRWWERFEDPELDRLVQVAMAGNFELAQAAANVQAAYARRGVVNAERLPSLDAEASYTAAGAGKKSATFNGPPPGMHGELFGAGAIAAWEVDLWGRVARLVESADADIEAARNAYHAAAVALAAETALAYIDVRTLDERLAALEQNIELQLKTLELTEERYDSGEGRLLDVSQARRLLERTRAERPRLEQARSQAENRLAALLGELPQDGLIGTGADELTLPEINGLGLPAQLLVRRPDVLEAEQGYAAAIARIGSAEAERFPRLTIAGSFTLQADDAANYFSPESFIYSIGPTLQLPIFEGGRITSNIAVRKSEADAARWKLEQTLVTAVREVEDAATGVVKAEARYGHMRDAYDAAALTVEQTQERYDAGMTDLFELTDSQRQLVEIEDSVLVARQQTFVQTVYLYRALGGGWAALDQMRPLETVPANAHLSLTEKTSDDTDHED
ncbi:efflux transporter outer membrane subunit [Ruficoccus sp. ZRK36]|uniref:efflux transporter outer membrane subunit n=1 Tax=Ruficoccus sp. ZRK36 TaxID=2866311 RepID=UPI001C73D46A|nr:efflux transporter outer membrane subunit [Ruficoccus sp. ZRK36]QYY35070.1 efflux transporter outer membrane subunit [Ruficoccus sp. ZRK36]